jgi:hypothetical protein
VTGERKVKLAGDISCERETWCNYLLFERVWRWVWDALPAEFRGIVTDKLKRVVFTAEPISPARAGGRAATRLSDGIATAAGEVFIHSAACSTTESAGYLLAHELRHVWQFATQYLAGSPSADDFEAMREAWREMKKEADADLFAKRLGYRASYPKPQFAFRGWPIDGSFLAIARSWGYLSDAERSSLVERAGGGSEIFDFQPEELTSKGVENLAGFPLIYDTGNLERFQRVFREVWTALPVDVLAVVERQLQTIRFTEVPQMPDGERVIGYATNSGEVAISSRACVDDMTTAHLIAHELRHCYQYGIDYRGEPTTEELSRLASQWISDRFEEDADGFAASLGFPAPKPQNQFIFRDVPEDSHFKCLANGWPALDSNRRLDLAAEATAKARESRGNL